jgi:hypothetical protein
MPIPAEHQDKLVDAGLHFMRTLSDVYGSDRAMEFWSVLSDVVDPDLKGLTFQAMLTGRLGHIITIRGFNPGISKVAVIKAIRTFDRKAPGLKEAMDVYNTVEGGRPAQLEVNFEQLGNARKHFLELGCVI